MIETANVQKVSNNETLRGLRVFRQSLGIGAVLVVIGVALGYAVDPRFLLLTLLPAFGLSLTSITGWCPMVYILERMPWNR